MEENQTSTSTQSSSGDSKKWVVIAVVGIIVILIAAGGGFLFLNSKEGSLTEEMMEGSEEDLQTSPAPTSEPEAMMPGDYKNGTYTAVGTYEYHSGTESIGVTVTLNNGVIEKVSVEEMAKAPVSKKIQADFAANFQSEVVGKNIDEVKLGKISGSSLTPIGFNAALEDIKAQASAS